MATVLWQDLQTGALDRCSLRGVPGGLRLTGTVLTPAFGAPFEISYLVEVDEHGHTRVVYLTLDGGDGPISHTLLADGAGRWAWEGGAELDEVAGSLDVDLTVTPATNTLPIRRLAALEVGQAADLQVAWVQFPGLEVLGSAQRYQRLAPDRWHFSSDGFQAELLVDPDGLVLDYAGLFRSLAYRPD